MNKKKTKRVKSSRNLGNEIAARQKTFFESGAPFSLFLLVLYVAALGLILSYDHTKGADIRSISWPPIKDVLTVSSLLLIISIVMGLYVAHYQPAIVKKYGRGMVIMLTIVLMTAVVRLLSIQGSPYLMVIPAMIVGIMLTIGYTQRFAIAVSSYFIIISALALPNSPEVLRETLAVLLTTSSGMGISVLLLREIRTRSRLLEVCLIAALVVFAMAWVTGLWSNIDSQIILKNSLWAGVGALLVGFLMQGLLPLVEKLFHTATGMTLLDYGEATKPLLKRLAVEAPGTFNHSWQIGMLAEAAAEAISANGLLCRVGSYYHDIGKLSKPRYFVENQAESFNQHKELSPTMSRMIIIGHVKDGLELAREYRLPKILHQFIECHHGTTLVEYFYHEATKQSSESGQPVLETEFRYPGPKPYTKEAAIVMIADAVEGATRAMQEPTPSRIEALVHAMSMKRLEDGQFDNCDLTMRELQRIEASLTKSLCGMYHGRIAYPKTEQETKPKYRSRTANGHV